MTHLKWVTLHDKQSNSVKIIWASDNVSLDIPSFDFADLSSIDDGELGLESNDELGNS